MTLSKLIERTVSIALQKKWDTLYWCIDLHGTIVNPTYKELENGLDYYYLSKECLRILSESKGNVLILYTCSHPHEIEKILKLFWNDGIIFKYVNENPEVKNTSYGFYEKKPYFNILLEDKAGFDPNDWKEIYSMIGTQWWYDVCERLILKNQ